MLISCIKKLLPATFTALTFGWMHGKRLFALKMSHVKLKQKLAAAVLIILLSLLWPFANTHNLLPITVIYGRQQGHAGSKTLLQQDPPVLNWGVS